MVCLFQVAEQRSNFTSGFLTVYEASLGSIPSNSPLRAK
jgi:hypothetical protein